MRESGFLSFLRITDGDSEIDEISAGLLSNGIMISDHAISYERWSRFVILELKLH